MTEARKYLTWLGIIVVLLVALAGSIVLKDRFGTVENSNQNANSAQFTAELPGHTYKYDYVSNYEFGKDWNEETTDGKIIRTDLDTNEVVTVIPSVKKAFPDPERPEQVQLDVIARSPEKPYLYLTYVHIEGASGLIRYDWSTNSFTKLNSHFDSFSGSNNEATPFIVSIRKDFNDKNSQTLYLVDLDADKTEVLAELPSGQTFNICGIEGCLGDTGITVNWVDKDTFTIAVYDSTPGPIDPETGVPKAIVLETRRFNINK